MTKSNQDRKQEKRQMAAAGLAGYVLAMELMSRLEDRKLLKPEEGASIVDDALAALKEADADHSSPVLQDAQRLLDAHFKRQKHQLGL